MQLQHWPSGLGLHLSSMASVLGPSAAHKCLETLRIQCQLNESLKGLLKWTFLVAVLTVYAADNMISPCAPPTQAGLGLGQLVPQDCWWPLRLWPWLWPWPLRAGSLALGQ